MAASESTSLSGTWIEGEMAMGTDCVHAGVSPCEKTGAILTPIYQSTTFVQPSIDGYLSKGYSYSRTKNPTVEVLSEKVAQLEGGVGATMFGTGMAATVTVMSAFLNTGDHVIITDCSYGGTNRAARLLFMEKFKVEVTFADFSDVAKVEACVKPNTKMIFSESPTNPTMMLADVTALSALAKKIGAVHVCDSTFATPIVMRPLKLGADMVVTSTTKFYCGHNMTVGGAVVCATAEHQETIRFWQNVHGNIMAPQAAFYQLQTAKTMEVRVMRQSASALQIATWLEAHPKIEWVRYPGLASHPQKALADKMHTTGLHGSMLCCELKGGVKAGRALMDGIQRPWSLCENLGSVESIMTCPSVMTHANMLKEDRLKVGITDGFVRVSVGLEDPKDLIAALEKVLDSIVIDNSKKQKT
mmetsp:Transcript_18052/g.41301  ORF Transcript_18052/g.41301 Transcript_18052/m.41301 type:complete len:415 (+) Transcript_18052:139-1383(+)|eukprot:CAMPEP_0172604698 /NCGR_PEP_ID=MMETSP1068-20121228/24950_1 /TAXON_ID=35684 /ORGANISM="Pseudopedinella elastica, Strain CCMP716" /LENGTH=414 /DNA_ID=CAMNT_0013406857 /DNA_START=127 /DNA_END=1371 /DNA_ORIENTATION=-